MLQAVVDCGALQGLVTCLEEFDPAVKEAACYTLGYVAGHSPELAQQVGHLFPMLHCTASCRVIRCRPSDQQHDGQLCNHKPELD